VLNSDEVAVLSKEYVYMFHFTEHNQEIVMKISELKIFKKQSRDNFLESG
jgi:hypothetical protein